MNQYSFEFVAHQVTWSEGIDVKNPAIAFRFFDFPTLVIYRKFIILLYEVIRRLKR